MKRIAFLFALLLFLTGSPTASAAGTDAKQAADALYELGLFKGTGVNQNGVPIFDLEQVPTRNQAVIMLVRLLGKEEDALSKTWNVPFKDVPAGSVTEPYIGYAYANGLTKGTTATTYSGKNTVTRNQYLLFLLRALGYNTLWTDETHELLPSEAPEVAEKLRLTEGVSGGTFTRGEVAILSCRALDTYMRWNKPHVQTLREALGLGQSPMLTDWPLSVTEQKYDSYEEADRQTTLLAGDYKVAREIPVKTGTLRSSVLEGGPHGTSWSLRLLCRDGTVVLLPLHTPNTWYNEEPLNLQYHPDMETVTYEAVLPEDLPWIGRPLRKAGTYRYTFRLSDNTATVSEITPDAAASEAQSGGSGQSGSGSGQSGSGSGQSGGSSGQSGNSQPAQTAGQQGAAQSGQNANGEQYATFEQCFEAANLTIFNGSERVTPTKEDVVFSKVLLRKEVGNYAEWFPLGNVPPYPSGDEDHLVWLIVADVDGTVRGLSPTGGSTMENPRVILISDACTGAVQARMYAVRP